MANAILTPQMITREALRVLSGSLQFTKNINRDYDNRFAKSGAKIGNTIDIRKPARFTTRKGPVASIQEYTETSFPLSLDTQYGVDLDFTSQELSLSLDDFSQRVIVPAITNIANTIDGDGFALLKKVYNAVGTPGVALTGGTTGNSLTAALNAGVKLDNALAPRNSERCMIVDPAWQALVTSNGLNLFNPTGNVSAQYETGEITTALGFKWYMDQSAPSHTVGTYGGTPLVKGASQSGSSLITDGWTPTTTTLNEGDVFTIAGVYAVHAQTKNAYPALKQFTVTAASTTDGSGNSTLAISPAIVLTGPFKNVSAGPANDAPITVLGASGAVGTQSVAYHKDAFVFATAPLQVPNGTDMASVETDTDTGLSIRYIRDYDPVNDKFITRFDILGGYATLYEELACKIYTG